MAESTTYFYKPGVHSHNAFRSVAPPDRGAVSRLRSLLLLIGLVCLGYFAYTWANQSVYQAYQNWAFDQQKAGRSSESMPLPADGSVIGRVNIGRLNLSAVVRQGVDEGTLKEAVGHVPSTAMPGQAGNFAIAAHRDTLFRGLKDIKLGDTIMFESQKGDYHYEVAATKIVKPSDVSVLRPDGGGLVPLDKGAAPPKLLTMITCYPFYYVGAAPKRFIVEARLVDGAAAAKTPMLN
jgi:sortase A